MANLQSDSTQQENKKFENQKSFSQKNPTLKRRLIQVISALIYNADVTHWFNGTISQTGLKKVCVPGLNCYSCPGAISSCPLGALQNTLASGKCSVRRKITVRKMPLKTLRRTAAGCRECVINAENR